MWVDKSDQYVALHVGGIFIKQISEHKVIVMYMYRMPLVASYTSHYINYSCNQQLLNYSTPYTGTHVLAA